jgi:hypothetical protein
MTDQHKKPSLGGLIFATAVTWAIYYVAGMLAWYYIIKPWLWSF